MSDSVIIEDILVGEGKAAERGALITALSYGMLFHVEHHLFPAVPTRHLAELARRIDAVTPRWQMRRVLQ